MKMKREKMKLFSTLMDSLKESIATGITSARNMIQHRIGHLDKYQEHAE